MGARVVGVEPDRDAELAQSLHERHALETEGPLDLLSLLVPEGPSSGPGWPLPTETNRPTPRSRGARS